MAFMVTEIAGVRSSVVGGERLVDRSVMAGGAP
jgi:hypothetical protein